MYAQLCQGKKYNSCAYVFGDFDKVAINNFSKLEAFKTQNVPITVERRRKKCTQKSNYFILKNAPAKAREY
jgi:hypothetical protein